jgi:hypothetical protein
MPAPLLMAIAAKRGTQPSLSNCFTWAFLMVEYSAYEKADTSKMITMEDGGMSRFDRVDDVKTEDMNARRVNVMRSPREEAIGGAILSAWSKINSRHSKHEENYTGI